jgi:hypothetical protein
MKEIPIKYQVRQAGQSFIKFKAYITSVIPAIVQEMSKPVQKVKPKLKKNPIIQKEAQ